MKTANISNCVINQTHDVTESHLRAVEAITAACIEQMKVLAKLAESLHPAPNNTGIRVGD